MESYTPLTSTQNIRTYVSRVEQDLHTLTTAVASCHGALRLLNDELLTSDHRARFYFDKGVQYYQVNLGLLREKEEMSREIEDLHNNAAITKMDMFRLNDLNEVLQKRIFELEGVQEDQVAEARNLKATIAYLEAENSRIRWPSPIPVKFSYEKGQQPLVSPESVLDLQAEGDEVIEILLDRGRESNIAIHEDGNILPTAH